MTINAITNGEGGFSARQKLNQTITKINTVADGATANATDAQLRDRATHTGTQAISTVAGLQSALDSKVSAEVGKGLSSNDYTSAEKAKLAGLESSRFKGMFPTLSALQSSVSSPSAGDYADVDAGTGSEVQRYIWDASDSLWAAQQGASGQLTAAQIKAQYESNPDTNAFTDTEKTKLSSIATGATANATDAQLRDRATHTGTQAIATVTGLQSALDSKVAKVTSTDNALVRFDGANGDVQNSAVLVSDTNNLSGVASLQLTGGAGTDGTVSWNDGDGTLDIALKGGQTVLQVGQEQVVRVLNNTGVALSDGQAVYISGAQGQRPTVALADADIEATSSATIGIVTEPIANGAEGFVTLSGLVRNIDTSAWAEGAQLYVSSTAGALTTTKPIPPAHAVRIGWVVRQHATSGSVLVHVQNGYELDELHDVLISGLADGQILAYDAATGLWKNTANNPTALTGPTSITANSASTALTITQDGTGNALEVRDVSGDATPFVIDANGNVGIKVSTGVTGAALTVAGDASSGAIDGFRSSNDAGGYALRFFKNRNANVYLNTSVQSGDNLGGMQCYGADGTAYAVGAQILSQVDGAPATGSIPARLTLSTTPVGGTTPVERMRINSSGGVGIGAIAEATETLRLGKSLTGGVAVVQQWNVGTVQSDITGGAYYYRTFANTAAANFTITEIMHYDTVQGPFGAGSTVTSQIGFHARPSLIGAVSNFGFYGNIPAGANRWNFFADGSAANHFAGNVLIGTITDSGNKLQVTGNTNVDGNLTYTGTKSHWMGEVYMVGNTTATAITNTANYFKVAGTTIIGNNMGFDNGGGISNRLRYTGAVTRMFHIAVSFSFSTASNSQNVEFAVAKNGVRIDSSVQETKTGTAGDVQSTALHVVATLATNDYLEVFCRNLSTASNVTVKNLNFFAMNAN